MEHQVSRMQELTPTSEAGQVGEEEERTVRCDQQRNV